VSVVDIASVRRLRPPLVAIWLAAIVVALLLQHYWLARGVTPMTAATDRISPCAGGVQTGRYNSLALRLASAAFSGVSGLTMVSSLASRPLPPVLPYRALPALTILAVCVLAWI